MTNSIADIEKSELILVTGSNTTEAHPIISSCIKRPVELGRTNLIIIFVVKQRNQQTIWLRQEKLIL